MTAKTPITPQSLATQVMVDSHQVNVIDELNQIEKKVFFFFFKYFILSYLLYSKAAFFLFQKKIFTLIERKMFFHSIIKINRNDYFI